MIGILIKTIIDHMKISDLVSIFLFNQTIKIKRILKRHFLKFDNMHYLVLNDYYLVMALRGTSDQITSFDNISQMVFCSFPLLFQYWIIQPIINHRNLHFCKLTATSHPITTPLIWAIRAILFPVMTRDLVITGIFAR